MSNDTVLGFLNDKEYFNFIYNHDVKTVEIWNMYRAYCINNGLSPIKKHEFYRELVQIYGFTKKIINGFDYFYKYCSFEEEHNIKNQVDLVENKLKTF